MTDPRTVLEIEIGEIVLHGLPEQHASYVDGLGPLVRQRLGELAELGAHPSSVADTEVSGAAGLADAVAQQVWRAASAQLPASGATP